MSANRFNWRLVWGVSSLGLVFAALTIMGSIPRAATVWVALGMIAIVGVAVGLRVSDRPLLHGLVAGFLTGLIAVEIQALFLTTYFVNNPQNADIEMPFGWPPRLVTAVLGPLNAVVAAVIAGVLAWACWKVRAARSGAIGSSRQHREDGGSAL
jgi:hypothetical protein